MGCLAHPSQSQCANVSVGSIVDILINCCCCCCCCVATLLQSPLHGKCSQSKTSESTFFAFLWTSIVVILYMTRQPHLHSAVQSDEPWCLVCPKRPPKPCISLISEASLGTSTYLQVKLIKLFCLLQICPIAELASFGPLTYTTTGGMGPQCEGAHKTQPNRRLTVIEG